jgi:hypothetical protein
MLDVCGHSNEDTDAAVLDRLEEVKRLSPADQAKLTILPQSAPCRWLPAVTCIARHRPVGVAPHTL